MNNPDKMIRNLKRRRLRIAALAVVCIATLCVAFYSVTVTKRYDAAFSQQWFEEHISGEDPEIELPIVLSEMYQGSASHSYLIFTTYFQFALFGLLFGTLLVELFASPHVLKVAMWEKIQKLESEVEALKQSGNDQQPPGHVRK